MPENDIVRCEECVHRKWFHTDFGGFWYCDEYADPYVTGPTSGEEGEFCSAGIRRGDLDEET